MKTTVYPLFKTVVKLSLLFFFFTSNSAAQDTISKQNLVATELFKLDSLFQKYYNPLFSNKKENVDWAYLDFLSKINIKDRHASSSQDLIKAKQNLLKSELGVSAKIGYLDNQVSRAFDLDNNISFNRRIQAGLDWDLLKGGLLENRAKAKALTYDATFEEMKLNDEISKDLYLNRFNKTIISFNKLKIEVLNTRRNLISSLFNSEESLYFSKHLNKEELLDAQLRNAEIAGLLQVFEPYNNYSSLKEEPFNGSDNIPLFDLNYEVVLQKFNTLKRDSIAELLKTESSLLSKWYNEISLGSFTRYNYFDLASNAPQYNRSFVSLGMNLSVPIPLNISKKQQVKAGELNAKLIEFDKKNNLYEEELLNDLYEFRYKLKQYIGFYYKQQKQYESLRIEEVKRKLRSNYFSSINAIKLIDDILATELEMIDLKQNLYLKLIRIHQKVPESKLQDLVKNFNIPQINETGNEIKRSVYIWTSVFSKNSPAFLSQYILYNKCANIILAHQKEDPFKTEKKELINSVINNNCSVELLFGQNDLMQEKNTSQWFEKELSGYDLKSISGIHLDIEPHTFEDWKTNKEELLTRYIALISEVKALANKKGLKLAVSVPLYYPETVMEKVFSIADKVYFMCYENIDQNYIERKLSIYNKYKPQIDIAIRTEDFSNRISMENYIKEIASKLQIKNITIHDLKRLLLFDEGEFGK